MPITPVSIAAYGPTPGIALRPATIPLVGSLSGIDARRVLDLVEADDVRVQTRECLQQLVALAAEFGRLVEVVRRGTRGLPLPPHVLSSGLTGFVFG